MTRRLKECATTESCKHQKQKLWKDVPGFNCYSRARDDHLVLSLENIRLKITNTIEDNCIQRHWLMFDAASDIINSNIFLEDQIILCLVQFPVVDCDER